MLMAELWRSLLRRWHWVVVGGLLSAGLAVGVFVQIGPQYSLVTESLLLPPTSAVPQGANPYLGLSTLSATVDVVSAGVLGPKTYDTMRASGISATMVVGSDPASPAPLIISTVTAKTSADAVRASKFILAAIPSTLADLQSRSNVPVSQRITSTVIVENYQPTVVRKSQLRDTIAAFIFSGVLTLLIVGAFDALVTRSGRRRGRGRRGDTDDGAQTADTTRPEGTPEDEAVEAERSPGRRTKPSQEVSAEDEMGSADAEGEEFADRDRSRAVVGRR